MPRIVASVLRLPVPPAVAAMSATVITAYVKLLAVPATVVAIVPVPATVVRAAAAAIPEIAAPQRPRTAASPNNGSR